MSIIKKIEDIERVVKDSNLTPEKKYEKIREILLIGQNRTKEEMFFSIFMVIVGLFLIIFMVIIELATGLGSGDLRVGLALAGGAMAVGFTGDINIKFHWVRAGGSVAVVVLIMLVNFPPFETKQPSQEVNKSIDSKIASKNIFYLIPGFFGSSAYAQTQGTTESNNTNRSPSGNMSFGAGSEDTPTVKYNFKITYPIGMNELRKKSFDLSESLAGSQNPNEVTIYSVGSILKAPVNSIIYGQNYDVEIKYHRLVSPNSINSVKSAISKLIQDEVSKQNTEIKASEGVVNDSDILIEFQPKW